MCCFCILRLSPPTPGLSLGRRRMGAQLDGGIPFYASRHQLRAWPRAGGGVAAYEAGSLHSSFFLVAHCFRHGSEAMAKRHMDKEFAGGLRRKEALDQLLQFTGSKTT